MHDITDGGETTQTLQKLSCPALLATWAGQLFSATSVPLWFHTCFGSNLPYGTEHLLPFPLLHHIFSVLPAMAKLNLHDAWTS